MNIREKINAEIDAFYKENADEIQKTINEVKGRIDEINKELLEL